MRLTSVPSVGLLAVVLVLNGIGLDSVGQRDGQRAVPLFHHVHLVLGEPEAFADYYLRLFLPGRVERGRFLGHAGVKDSTAMLLFSSGQNRRQGDQSVVWQMGWGTVTLDQSYRQHYAQEVNWKPPYSSLGKELHLHIRSREVKAAAGWFRDVLGAEVEVSADAATAQNAEVRAIARFEGLSLAIHPSQEGLVGSRDAGTVDHLAFSVRSLRDVDAPMTVQTRDAIYAPVAKRSAMIIGPDDLLIELLEEVW